MKVTIVNFCLCGSTQIDVLGVKDGRTVVECVDCGIIRTYDPPANYSDLYTEGDTYHARQDVHIPYRERLLHDKLVGDGRVKKLLRQQKLLDVGCCNGGFLIAANDAGFDVVGLEINPGMAEWAQKKSGVKVYNSWKDLGDKTFDIITYHDVIEHIPNIILEIYVVHQHLADNGMWVIDTPDTDDNRFKVLGMDWHHMKPIEHLWFFNEENLKNIINGHLFKVVDVDYPIEGKIVLYCRKQNLPKIVQTE